MIRHRTHTGLSLLELLLFLGLLSAVGVTVLPLLFASTENRLFQQTVSVVEQNGVQILQSIASHVAQGERILDPAIGNAASVLTLQMQSGALHPTIVGVSSGILIVIQRTNGQEISSSQVAVENFRVRNTSASPSRQSVTVSFDLSRVLRLQQPHSYRRHFEAAFSLLPDDLPTTMGCLCDVPFCSAANTYRWEICTAGSCYAATTPLGCP